MTDGMNDPLALLEAELARVSPSPGFAARVREAVAAQSQDELTILRDELASVAPSPEFAARIRQRIDDDASRRSTWAFFNWRWAVPAGVLAAGLLVTVLWLRPQSPAPQPSVTADAAAPTSHAPGVTPEVPVRPPAGSAAVHPVAVAAHQRREDVKPEARDPFLEVITDQPALLRALEARVFASEVAVDPTEPAGTYTAPKLEVLPIEVSPISVFLVPDPRLPVGLSPIILRIAAESAERSFR